MRRATSPDTATPEPLNKVKGQLTGRGTALIGAAPRADESGGALSLWVVLMVPVSAFAAVVAMAGPQRLAAESSMDDAADDLAALAVVWRDGHSDPSGAVPAFPPECSIDHPQWIEKLRLLDEELQAAKQASHAEIAQDDAQSEENKRVAEEAKKDAERDLAAENARQEGWKETCERVFEWIARDLGYLGVDVNSLSGFYSDSYLYTADSYALHRGGRSAVQDLEAGGGAGLGACRHRC